MSTPGKRAQLPQEIFKYRVIYPGGTYVRVSPAVDSERTGDIIEYGAVFSASKSLVLDGINYVKLADDRGWVFGNKGDTEVLELVEVVRVPGGLVEASSSSLPESSTLATIRPKAVGASASVSTAPATTTAAATAAAAAPVSSLGAGGDGGDEWGKAADSVVVTESESFLVSHTVHRAAREREKLSQTGRADSRFWKDAALKCAACETFDAFVRLSAEVETEQVANPAGGGGRRPQDLQVRSLIALIVSVTRQCAPEVAELAGLETVLWVFSHLGTRSAPVLQLAIAAANERFEWLDEERQAELLQVLVDIGNRTWHHVSDLGRLASAVPDEIKSLLQRWLIIRSFEIEYVWEDDVGGPQPGGAERFAVHRTPTASRPRLSWLTLPDWLCGVVVPTARQRSRQVRRRRLDRLQRADEDAGFQDDLFSPRDEDEDDILYQGQGDGDGEGEGEGVWKGLRRHVRRIIADPDVQLAGII